MNEAVFPLDSFTTAVALFNSGWSAVSKYATPLSIALVTTVSPAFASIVPWGRMDLKDTKVR